jgi:formylglycine-generating enzyme required for sulfatase activity
MLRLRTALALLLLFPAAASAQEDLETAVSAMVRISGSRNGSPVRGSGFVVALLPGKATIVTASHVIEGAEALEVAFAADRTQRFPVDAFLGSEIGNPRGLAAFQVVGPIPAGVTSLSFETERQPQRGSELFLVGFPQMEVAPQTPRRALSGRRGTLLLIDQGIGEGSSGGPVLQGGKVVGIVTETDEQTTYAVNAVVAREALEGWGVKLEGQTRPEPPAVKTCVSGETLLENGIEFVRICPGTFTMGSAENDPRAFDDQKPAHQVTLTSELWLGKTEITNRQYRRFQPKQLGEDGLPATDITWTEAKAACEFLGGRLPTEAEWEYAARAGSQAAWSFGNDETELDDYAWHEKNADGKPHPVATRKPSGWGLHDMYGNVWEWVDDWYAPYEKGLQIDPAGPQAGDVRVVRGGSFASPAEYLRSAVRGNLGPESRGGAFGFRCARGPRHQP